MSPYLQKNTAFQAHIPESPAETLGIIVVIPCYDEPDILSTLQSLYECEKPDCHVEIIVVINDSERDGTTVKELNQTSLVKGEKWANEQTKPWLKTHFIYKSNLPHKRSGVGVARKAGMDEAVYRFEQIGKKSGIIACFDADSFCRPNYFVALQNHFKQNERTQLCCIYFEHPIDGKALTEVLPAGVRAPTYEAGIYEAIIKYELHLRYYVHAQQFCGFPLAVQTIGSSMAVRSDAYQQQGGMNRRKAGEDFYFIHKFTSLGKVSQLRETCVYPSPRKSHRVPFGTGKAVGDMLVSDATYSTYAPQTFIGLKAFFDQKQLLYTGKTHAIERLAQSLPPAVATFLDGISFTESLEEIRANTSREAAFYQRFFSWFNAFRMMKYVHHARDHYYANVPLRDAVQWLLSDVHKEEAAKDWTLKEALQYLRGLDMIEERPLR